MSNANSGNVKGMGYVPGAECIVAVPPDPPTAILGALLGITVFDSIALDNGKIVKLKAKLATNSSYTCVGCGKSSLNNTPYVYWVVTMKDGTQFESSHAMCGNSEAVFRQEWLIPIGGEELRSELLNEIIDDAKQLAEEVTGIPQPAN